MVLRGIFKIILWLRVERFPRASRSLQKLSLDGFLAPISP
jgi:hypothetical protein